LIFRFAKNIKLTLLKKISGIRGTIGGEAGTSLSPLDIVEMTAAFASLLERQDASRKKVVIGMDARISGKMVSQLSTQTLLAMGFDVIDLGLSTTPTVEMAVKAENASGGIIFTASHNGKEWNALKLLNEKGEFISEQQGVAMLDIAEQRAYRFASVDNLGSYHQNDKYIAYHIEKILALEFIEPELIRKRKFKVVVDCINSTGAVAIPPLLDALDCGYVLLNDDLSGNFAHDPEPLPKNLTALADKVKAENADLGIAVDPDVDRLVLVCEDGSMFGEELTIVAASEYMLGKKSSHLVSNMSSSRALKDLAKKAGVNYYASAVGEVNVVRKMKEVKALIGGEGNGGVIVPELHYGRDALVGIAIILNLLAEKNIKPSDLKASYPSYTIIKEKFEIDPELNIDKLLNEIKNDYIANEINEEDGLRVDFDKSWVHMRKSNTEAVIRVIAEAEHKEEAENLISQFSKYLKEIK
jgi:phosphomannomutase